jgi:hypothetical protein
MIYLHERLMMRAAALGHRLGWWLGGVLAVGLWKVKPLRPRLERWARGKETLAERVERKA